MPINKQGEVVRPHRRPATPYHTPPPAPAIQNQPAIPASNGSAVPQLLRVGAGVLGLLFLCFIASTIISSVKNLGSGTLSTTSPSTSRPGSSTITQPTSSYVNLPSSFNRSYSGTINDGNDFWLTLKKNGSKLEGKATTSRSWDKVSGTIETDGSFFLEAREKGNKHTGNYSGRFTSDRSIEGSWSSIGGYDGITFYLSQN